MFRILLRGPMRHPFAFLIVCSFLCASAYPQSWGTIQCDPGSTAPVPAWNSPGKPHVVEQLVCGQTVSVIGTGSFWTPSQYSVRAREYAKIQIADRVAYVDARYVRLLGTQEILPENKSAAATAEKSLIREDEEQRKWDLIPKDKVKLRDEMLLDPVYINGPRTVTGTLTNNSEFPVSHLRLLVRIYDCSGKPNSDRSNCEIIGEVKPVVPASIPAGQTRRVTASTPFEATPRVRGTFAWNCQILGVRAE
jgi:hypothetical protein